MDKRVAIDPVALFLKGKALWVWYLIHHPNEPLTRPETEQVFEKLTPAYKPLALRNSWKFLCFMLKDKNQNLIISYLTLRKLIGILGILLPLACLLGGSLFQNAPVKDSISAYYHSNMRDILVGLLVGVSLFLMTYKGYDWYDTLLAIASGIAGLGIAIFPCASRIEPSSAVGMFQLTPPAAGYLHYGSSVLFFVLLGATSFFLFTLGDKTKWTRRKSIRNGIYRVCGLVIFASLLSLGIFTIVLGDELVTTAWTFVFETVMLLAFGISWLVKGETLFADRPGEQRFDLTMARQTV